MLQLTIPDQTKILFEVAFEPQSAIIDKLETEQISDEGEIKNLRGKKNKVAVGVPYYENLISRLKDLSLEIPHEIKKQVNEYDFHFVRLNCEFLADRDCRFEWARFGVELKLKDSKNSRRNLLRGIFHQMRY